MRRYGYLLTSRYARLALAAVAAVALANPAEAVLTNKYTFNDGTANDSIGGQNGTLVDNTGIALYVAGAIDLSANTTGSNQDFSLPTTVGAFVDLPNGVISSAVGGDGQMSLEIWFTVSQNKTWAEVYSFGTSNNGEGTSVGGSASDYLALIPQSGPPAPALPDFRFTTHSAAGAETPLIGSTTPAPAGVKQHVVVTFDQLDTNAGANPNGTARMYTNFDNLADPVVAGAIAPLLHLLPDVNNWLGRSPWPDSLFDGSIDEFRIYDHAMTANEVVASNLAGPELVASPTLTIDRATGAMSVTNGSNQSLTIKGYTIASAGGALNPPTWASIDADNMFDPDGTWNKTTQTNLQLTESTSNGATVGGVLGIGASRAIGTPWRKSPTEDVTFNYTLTDGTTGFGLVQFTGNGGAPLGRSDFNGDGDVNAADWALFLPNGFTSFPAETTVGAYLKGDLDGDKDNDYQDFVRFKADFIASQGEAAWVALGAVPEPGCVALGAAALAALVTTNRRRRQS